jgi:hypothetical protein
MNLPTNITDLGNGSFRCQECDQVFSPLLGPGGRRLRASLQCPNGCGRPEPQEIEIDLHGYTLSDAITVANQRIQEAYENGFDFITLIHGSPFIAHWIQSQAMGRGGIKWALRGILARGEWRAFVFGRRSKQHEVGDGAMRLRLRRNPKPRLEPVWGEIPERAYE